MYLDDNRSVFPGSGSRNTYGPQPDDWIYWQPSLQATRPVSKSPVGAALSGVNSNLFRCPMDRDNQGRVDDGQGTEIFGYSYTMTSYSLDGTVNHGMTSLPAYPFKQPSIKKPVNKLMFVEEQTSQRRDEASNPTGGVVNDGRWLPPNDSLTIRHSKKSDAAYADGHVVAMKTIVDTADLNLRPDY